THIAENFLSQYPKSNWSQFEPEYTIINNPNDFFGEAKTDWQDKIINHNAIWNQYRATVTGGSRTVSYRISGQASKQNGILIGNELKRYGISPRLDANITKRLSAVASVNYKY